MHDRIQQQWITFEILNFAFSFIYTNLSFLTGKDLVDQGTHGLHWSLWERCPLSTQLQYWGCYHMVRGVEGPRGLPLVSKRWENMATLVHSENYTRSKMHTTRLSLHTWQEFPECEKQITLNTLRAHNIGGLMRGVLYPGARDAQLFHHTMKQALDIAIWHFVRRSGAVAWHNGQQTHH